MKKIAIIIPIYNEEKVIQKFYLELRKEIRKIKKYKFIIKFIIDKSKDNTVQIVKKICLRDKKLQALILSHRFGHQPALMTGIKNSLNSDAIIMMDGDLQHPPKLIKNLIKKYEEGYEIVNTRRVERYFSIKNYFSNFFYFIFKIITQYDLLSGSADFRLINQKIAKIIASKFKEKNLFLRGIIVFMGFRNCSINYLSDKRYYGHSKYNLLLSIKFAVSSIIAFTARPLYLIFFIGIFFLFINVFVLAYMIYYYIYYSFVPSEWFTLLIILLALSFLIFIVGIIGLYIGAIYEEIKNRPYDLIQEHINKYK